MENNERNLGIFTMLRSNGFRRKWTFKNKIFDSMEAAYEYLIKLIRRKG